MRRGFLTFFLSIILTGTGFSQIRAKVDSTLWMLSLPEIQSYRAYYLQEMDKLQQEKNQLIQRGIEDGERLLASNPDPKVFDDILIRLADLYYYQDKDAYLKRMEAYDNILLQYEQGLITQVPDEPRPDFSKSLKIYQRIIDEFPSGELVDDAIYNKAYLYEEQGWFKEAHQIYLYLINAYPESPYVPEGYIRLGEHYFNPPINDLDRAIQNYKKVLQFKGSQRYNEALYKLGWSHYRLSQYPEAISYFTSLVNGYASAQQIDPSLRSTQIDLRDESLAYIAISFIDFGGPTKTRDYLRGIGNPGWSEEVLAKLGSVYMDDKEDYREAIHTFDILLDYLPASQNAPSYHKKIIDCYQALNDSVNSFEIRHKLFLIYKPNGLWWTQTADEKAKLQAYKLTEQALRENINTMIQLAEDAESLPLFENSVDLCRSYLETFPEDVYAYMIRWNLALILDTKLYQFKEALQEYLTISMLYNEQEYENFSREKGLATIKDAAENAIVVADSLVQQERYAALAERTMSTSDGKEPMPLTSAESWLAMAYDNYIKLFPFDKNMPTILVNAGALYYVHNQYNEALKYFKTLMKYFPKSEQVRTVQYNILESYFGKKDYDSAEILAKKIIDSNASEDIKEKCRKRLGEAIFLKAQALAAAGNSQLAADEFYRMALEAPTLEFADRALFNAGTEYDKIQRYESAIHAYELLRVSYRGSKLFLDAMNNLAFNYSETGNYPLAAARYESLSELLRDDEKARDALYNAWMYYEKAEIWLKALNSGNTYSNKYPQSKDAPSICFKTGDYHFKLGNDQDALDLYNGFTQRFPDSPLGVEAYFKVGWYYSEITSLDKAEAAFQNAYTTSESLNQRGLDANVFYAAEALYFSTRMKHARYLEIAFRMPQRILDRALNQKQQLLQDLLTQYTRVVKYGTIRLPESIYQLGEVYEDFALAWLNQELPVLNETQQAVKEKKINERAIQIYGKALSQYRKGIQALNKVKADIVAQTVQEDSVETTQSSDSLLSLTQHWLEKVEEKVSESLYQMAEINYRSVDRFLKAPIPSDLETAGRLEYRSQVLVKAIRPLLDAVVQAHQRNLQVADSLGLSNQWTEASQAKILSSLALLAREYKKLAFDALKAYQEDNAVYREKILEKEEDVSQEWVLSIGNFVELSKSYAQAAIIFTKTGVQKGVNCGIPKDSLLQSQERMVQFVLQIADSLEHQIFIGTVDQKKALDFFEIAGELYFEECLAVFEDHTFFLTEQLKTVLETAYQTEKAFPSPSPSGDWIPIRLVKMDPDAYAENLNIPVQQVVVRPDSTWWYHIMDIPDWYTTGLYMRGWQQLQRHFSSEVFWSVDSLLQISGGFPNEQNNSLLIRKNIVIPGLPVFGEILFGSIDVQQVYLNNHLVTGDVEEGSIPCTHYLKQGKNLLATKWICQEPFSVSAVLMIRYIPEAALPHSGG